jgi:hypothetical protein
MSADCVDKASVRPPRFRVEHRSHTVSQTSLYYKAARLSHYQLLPCPSSHPLDLYFPSGASSRNSRGTSLPNHLPLSTSLFWPLWNWPNYPVKRWGLARLRIIYNAPAGIWSWPISYTTIPCPCRPRSNKKGVGSQLTNWPPHARLFSVTETSPHSPIVTVKNAVIIVVQFVPAKQASF